MLKKRSTIFFISDFYNTKDFHDAFKVLKHAHDVVAVVLRDRGDYVLPGVGLVPLYDSEQGKVEWIDTFNKNLVDNCTRLSEIDERSILRYKDSVLYFP